MELSSTQLLYLTEMGIDVWSHTSSHHQRKVKPVNANQALKIVIYVSKDDSLTCFERSLLAWQKLIPQEMERSLQVFFVRTEETCIHFFRKNVADYLFIIGSSSKLIQVLQPFIGATLLLSKTSEPRVIASFKKTMMHGLIDMAT